MGSIREFQVADLAMPDAFTQLGTNRFDVIISHDALQHNPIANVHKILDNFNQSGDYLVVDIDRAGKNWRDIRVGSFRPVDITEPPFNLTVQCWDKNYYMAGSKSPKVRAEKEWFGIFKMPFVEKHQ